MRRLAKDTRERFCFWRFAFRASRFALLIGFWGCSSKPVVEDVSPNRAPESGGQITVTGRNFKQGAQITVDGVPLAETTVVNRTTLAATLPARDKPGVVQIGVLNPPDRRSGRTASFEYRDSTPPYIIGMVPAGVYAEAAPLRRIEVSFSEPLEAGKIRVTDDAGSVIAGDSSIAKSVLAFTAAKPLPSRHLYTVTILDVTDTAGNVMDTTPFQFSVAPQTR